MEHPKILGKNIREKNSIPIDGFSFSYVAPLNTNAPIVNINAQKQEIKIVKPLDATTPQFLMASKSGEILDIEIDILGQTRSSSSDIIQKIHLTNARITSLSQSGGNLIPTELLNGLANRRNPIEETISIIYQKMELTNGETKTVFAW